MANDGIASTPAGGMTAAPSAPAPAPAATPAPAAPVSAPAPAETTPAITPDAGATPAAPEQGSEAAPQAAPPHQGLLDEIDAMGSDIETPTQKTEDPDPSSLLTRPAGDATPTPDAGDTQSETDADETASGENRDDQAAAESTEDDVTDTDWKKLRPDDEAYITKHVPKSHMEPVRKAYREAAMARSFMNPNCPPEVFVENLEKKSGMRYGAVESAILRRNVEKDPTSLLGKIFEATADDSGNSEAYQRTLDAMIGTNTDYVVHALQKQGFNVGKGGEGASSANADTDISNFTDEEIDAFQGSAAFQQLNETFPEEAANLEKILAATKEARSKQSELTDADTQKKQAEADAAKATETKAAQDQTTKYNSDFSKVYGENVTSFVNTKLEKEFGLEVTAAEKEKNPQMALLKTAKKRLIESGGFEGTGDFDNDLYQWGQSRPGFKAAAKSMVEFVRAGETENAANAARELQGFADLFLAERIQKTPELKLIDELIQMVTKSQKAGLTVKEDSVPDSPLARSSQNGGAGKGFLDEIDNMR